MTTSTQTAEAAIPAGAFSFVTPTRAIFLRARVVGGRKLVERAENGAWVELGGEARARAVEALVR